MQLPASPFVTTRRSSPLILSLASAQYEVQEVQRLCYKVFVEAAGLSSLTNPDGLDKDEFDAYCDHLLVRDAEIALGYRMHGYSANPINGRDEQSRHV